jgi:hypothetical protein
VTIIHLLPTTFLLQLFPNSIRLNQLVWLFETLPLSFLELPPTLHAKWPTLPTVDNSRTSSLVTLTCEIRSSKSLVRFPTSTSTR